MFYIRHGFAWPFDGFETKLLSNLACNVQFDGSSDVTGLNGILIDV